MGDHVPNWARKCIRFIWRGTRNLLCIMPWTRRLLFPATRLAASFGPGDGSYAWSVFNQHRLRLEVAGFTTAERILEVGPGQNLGTAVLWWAHCITLTSRPVQIWCWDVFPNAAIDQQGYWQGVARSLLEAKPEGSIAPPSLITVLRDVAEGRRLPGITYLVLPLKELENRVKKERHLFDLIYSQAAIEHIWHVDAFWDAMSRVMHPGGWQSHRIDLADHGSRETNYIELLEWSQLSYWLTMRFVPGACNRWRAVHHLEKLGDLGLRILQSDRDMRPALPLPLARVSKAFRHLGADELRTTGLDVVARKSLHGD